MKSYYLNQLINHSQKLNDCVLTIGNFDGVHLGHQAMLQQLINTANAQNLSNAVMIFEPQPREFFNPITAPPRLTNLNEKLALLHNFGVQNVIIAEFNDDFRNLSAVDFAKILQNIGVKSLVLGDDFRFGHDRMGDSDFLREFGLPVVNLHTIVDNENLRISSTQVRENLLKGDLTKAKQLLGRDYAITGTVIHGDKIGRTLDFPTANIALNRIKPALYGIFGVEVSFNNAQENGQSFANFAKNGQNGLTGFHKNTLFGTANVGTRPSVHGVDWRLEVFLPEFDGDLYGQELTVTFLHFLHGEKNYDGLDALKSGILQDVQDLLIWREQNLKV
ncbi:riboflavin biosynthesis protein RibF [Faucicola mancuniensis]|uniref:riboflavin biosynthesis protein RibF n=1 Tax=Faucicola mancuniensis TaxID=1309795 RepID=UPI0028E56D59|nr:riboflavin biosynthesis protein RibF [uncultured Moraxella sp.]